MAITNFIPTIWSEHLLRALNKKYVAAAHCTRQYEGLIKEKGNKVKICDVGHIDIRDYSRNVNMRDPQNLSDEAREILINRAKYFNFQVDDLDKMQAMPELMEVALQNAANGLADEADQYIFSLYDGLGTGLESSTESPEILLNSFLDARTILYRYDVMENDDIVLEVSPDIAAVLLRAQINLQTDNKDLIETGCIGRLFGVKVYVSNNIVKDYDSPSGPDAPTSYHKCIMRTKRAIAYADQLSEIEAYRPELRFADAIKGLHLYGAKVIYPNEAVLIDVAFYNEP